MKYNKQWISMLALSLFSHACGHQSQAEHDCEELGRLAYHLERAARGTSMPLETPGVLRDTQACAEWAEAAATRCQQVLSDLAECSRSYNSTPALWQEQCLSEYFEVAGACVLPP